MFSVALTIPFGRLRHAKRALRLGHALALAWLIPALLLTGCGTSVTPPSGIEITSPDDDGLDDDELKGYLDEVLDWTYANRHLNLKEHAAWQILHGALAYERDFLVDNDGELVSAVDHILGGGRMAGWEPEPGVHLVDTGRQGLKVRVDPGSKQGQGHNDQWLAILAQCNVRPDEEIKLHDQTFTMQDYVHQVQWDVATNVHLEYSWTLIALSTYLPTDTKWTASDGQTWTIERLLESETEQDLQTSACGGTHRLIGMTMALNQYLIRDGGELQGPWKVADQQIQQAIAKARQFQNEDGSFSTNYIHRPGRSADLAQNLGSTGHVLEFLTLAMTDEQLRQPWVRRAVVRMCDMFQKSKSVPLECGALYHAAHGLILYRSRIYGPRSYAAPSETPTTPSDKNA